MEPLPKDKDDAVASPMKEHLDESDEKLQEEEEEDFFPFPNLPRIASCQSARDRFLVELLDTNEDGGLMWPDQPEGDDEPLQLPAMIRFTAKYNFSSTVTKDDDVLCVLLAVRDKRSYVLFFSGCDIMCHVANQGEDGEIYPWPTLSAAGKEMRKGTCNGWASFAVHDLRSPHHGVPLGALAKLLPNGFNNTLPESVIDGWDEVKPDDANYFLRFYVQELEELNKARSMAVEDSEDLRRRCVQTPNGLMYATASKSLIPYDMVVPRKRAVANVAQKVPMSSMTPAERRKQFNWSPGVAWNDEDDVPLADDDDSEPKAVVVKKRVSNKKPGVNMDDDESSKPKKAKKESLVNAAKKVVAKNDTPAKANKAVPIVFDDDEVAALPQFSREEIAAMDVGTQRSLKIIAQSVLCKVAGK